MIKQPLRGKKLIKKKRKSDQNNQTEFSRTKFGMSKLERDFAIDFLDAFGVLYIYQFHVGEIGRYYDFAVLKTNKTDLVLETKNGITSIKQDSFHGEIDFLIEVDGGFFHGDKRVIGEAELSPMQRRNQYVDNLKDRWASLNGLPLFRVWEFDIRNNPKMVLERLSHYVKLSKIEKKRKTCTKLPIPH